MRPVRRAFSLVEATLSFALFLLVLGLITQGFRQLSLITRYFDNKSQSFSLANDALQQIGRDCLEATRILVPAPGDLASYDQLELERMEIAHWDNYFPTPVPSPWNPQDPAFRETLLYFVTAGDLMLRITQGTDVQERLVAQKIQGLRVQRSGEVSLEVRIAMLEDTRVLTFSKCIWLPQSLRRVEP